MSTALQKNLRHYLDEKKISVHGLEKRAGLKPSAVQNILQGRSKRPGADLLLAVAKQLNCSVEDLVKPEKTSLQVSSPSHKWFPNLYIASLQVVQTLLDKKKRELRKEEILKMVDEVYLYSSQNSSSVVDEKFAAWLLDSRF